MVILINKLVMIYLLKKLKNNSTFLNVVKQMPIDNWFTFFDILLMPLQRLVGAGHEPTVPARSALHFFDTKKCKVDCKANAQNCKANVKCQPRYARRRCVKQMSTCVKDLSNETPGRVVISYFLQFVKCFL
jgi:hypothetical protein